MFRNVVPIGGIFYRIEGITLLREVSDIGNTEISKIWSATSSLSALCLCSRFDASASTPAAMPGTYWLYFTTLNLSGIVNPIYDFCRLPFKS